MLDEITLKLLTSLEDKPKYLHMGRSPVGAIQRAWQMEKAGLVSIGQDGWIYITEKGKEALKEGQNV